MISFRFHVVSITAVFLAIAVGVVVGSTYVEGAVVDQLESRIETVEDRADATREDNDRLEGELGDARAFIGLSADYAVTGRLVGETAVVVGVRGVDEAVVERTVVLARRAGATAPGVLWMEPRWALEGDGDVDALAEIVGGRRSDSAVELWGAAWTAVAAELAAPAPDAATDAAEAPGAGESAPVLPQLVEGGFLTLEAFDDSTTALTEVAGTSPGLLVVTGARADEAVAPVVPSALAAGADAGLATVVADVYVDAPEAPGRGVELGDAVEDALRERIVMVDDADREEGRLAAVLALASASDGQVGLHYGYGDGADSVLPSWTAP